MMGFRTDMTPNVTLFLKTQTGAQVTMPRIKLSRQCACLPRITTWLWSPKIHMKRWAQQHVPVVLVLERWKAKTDVPLDALRLASLAFIAKFQANWETLSQVNLEVCLKVLLRSTCAVTHTCVSTPIHSLAYIHTWEEGTSNMFSHLSSLNLTLYWT